MRAALAPSLVVLVSGLLALGLWGLYVVGWYNDDAVYLGLARSLAQGRGYRDAADVLQAVHDRYPVGYPLLLVPVQGSLVASRLLTLACGVLALGLTWLYYQRRLPSRALAVLALTGCNFFWLHSSTLVMSDIPFTCACMGYLLAAERALAGPRKASPMVALALLGTVCTSLRAVGVLLVPVTCVAAIRAGRTRQLVPYLLAAAAFQGPVLLLPLLKGYDLQAPFLDRRDLPRNLLYYFKVLPLTLWGDPFRLQLWPKMGWVAALVTWPLVLAGAWKARRERPDLGLPWLVVNAGLLAFWPYLTPRFVLHLVPLLYACVARSAPLMLAPMLICQLGFAAAGVYQSLTAPLQPDRELYGWVESHSRPGEVIATQSHSLWLFTGHPLLEMDPLFCVEHEEHWLEQMLQQRVRLLVHGGPPEDPLFALLPRRQDMFRPLRVASGWQAWEFIPPPALAGQLKAWREALALRRSGDLVGAERLLAPLSLSGARLELALLALQQRQPERAAAILRDRLAHDPQDARSKRLLQILGP